jgi:hypothetical protein
VSEDARSPRFVVGVAAADALAELAVPSLQHLR